MEGTIYIYMYCGFEEVPISLQSRVVCSPVQLMSLAGGSRRICSSSAKTEKHRGSKLKTGKYAGIWGAFIGLAYGIGPIIGVCLAGRSW